MPEVFTDFFTNQPFWALVIVVFMGLPIAGAVAWVVIRVLRRNNSDNPAE